MNIIKGNILESSEDYILHQCNCLTVKSHGLSKTIEEKYPEGVVYNKRRPLGRRNLAIEEDRAQPGTFLICGSKEQQIISIFGQWRSGKIGTSYFHSYPESNPPESKKQRILWFEEGLNKIGEHFFILKKKLSIAIPYNIGCGLAGGNWDNYLNAITEFQKTYREWVKVTLN